MLGQSGSDFWRLAKTNFDLALAHASAIREFFADHFALAEKARLNLRMSKAEKLTGKILSGRSDQNFAFDDLCYVIERAGFQLRPGKGSHRIYYKDGVVEIINVQPRNGKAKPYQVKQVRELLLKYKINIE